MGQQAQCGNYRPKVSPGNNYISFHGRASETKTRPAAGYLRGLDLFFVFFQVWHLNPQWLEPDFPDWGSRFSIVKLLWKSRWDFSLLLSWLLCSPVRPSAWTAVQLSMRCLLIPFLFCLSFHVLCRLQHGGADPGWSHQHRYQTSQLLWEARGWQLPRWVSASVQSCGFKQRCIKFPFFTQGNQSIMEAVQPNKMYLLQPFTSHLLGQCHYPLTGP